MSKQIIASANSTKPSALFVHGYASLAASVATGTSLLPAPISIGAELLGIDPYMYIQWLMMTKISARCGRDLSYVLERRRVPLNGHGLGRASHAAVGNVVKVARKVRVTSAIGRRSARNVPIAGALVSGGYGYWDTWNLGMAALAAASIEDGGKWHG